MQSFSYGVAAEQVIISNEDGSEVEQTIYHLAEMGRDKDGKVVDVFLLSDDEYALTAASKEELREELKKMLEGLSAPVTHITRVEEE